MADENVNIQDEADYYYDMTPTAEEIDNVLVDLVAALKDVGEFDVVKRVKAINGERAKFVLGEGGSGKTVIPGALDQLVAADGHGNAKANSGYLFSKIGAIAGFSNASILESKLQAMEIELTGTSSPEDYWGNSHGGTLAMAWNPLIQFLGNPALGSPVFSMADRAVVDIRGVSGTGSTNFGRNSRDGEHPEWRSKEAYWTFNGMPSPFKDGYKMYNDGLIYPYLQMGESSTVILREAALLQMRDGSSIMTAGNGQITVRGAGTPTDSGSSKVPYSAGYGRTLLQMEPGTVFCMNGGSNPVSPSGFGPLFLMVESGGDASQIYLTNQRLTAVSDLYGHDRDNPLHNYLYSGTSTPSPMTSSAGDTETWGLVRQKLSLDNYSIPSKSGSILKPSLMIQGKSNIVIGDTGITGIRIGAADGAEFYMDLEPNGGSSSLIRFGPGSGSKFVLDLSTNGSSNQFFKIGGGSDTTKQVFAFEPMCDTSIKFSPNIYNHKGKGVFGLNITPAKTDIVAQWNAFEGIFEGNQVFAQVEGNSHFEFWDNTKIIMRGQDVQVDLPDSYSNGPQISLEEEGTVDCTGMTYEQMITHLTDKQREELKYKLNPTFSSVGKSNVSGGTATSVEVQRDRYEIVMSPFSINKKSGSTTASNYIFTVSSSASYSSVSALQSSDAFNNKVKQLYGPNAVVDNVSYTKKYSTAIGAYLYYVNADITNIEKTFYSETQYALDTTWEDIPAADRPTIATNYITSSAKVISNGVRSDLKYKTSISGYSYISGTHLTENWCAPVLATDGPVHQMFGSPNLCMRGPSDVGLEGTNRKRSWRMYSYPISSPIESYDSSSTQEELINQFIHGADYAGFKTLIERASQNLTDYYFDHIDSITVSQEGITIQYVFEYKKLGQSSVPNNPTFEMIGKSELRIANNISITTDNIDGESAIKIAAPEGEVSFTLSELKALKNLITNT